MKFEDHSIIDCDRFFYIYVLYDSEKRPIYVGMTKDVEQRLKQHLYTENRDAAFFSFVQVRGERFALFLERFMIAALSPERNRTRKTLLTRNCGFSSYGIEALYDKCIQFSNEYKFGKSSNELVWDKWVENSIMSVDVIF